MNKGWAMECMCQWLNRLLCSHATLFLKRRIFVCSFVQAFVENEHISEFSAFDVSVFQSGKIYPPVHI